MTYLFTFNGRVRLDLHDGCAEQLRAPDPRTMRVTDKRKSPDYIRCEYPLCPDKIVEILESIETLRKRIEQ